MPAFFLILLFVGSLACGRSSQTGSRSAGRGGGPTATLGVEASAIVHGRVLSPTGVPAESVFVQVHVVERGAAATHNPVLTDRNGRYSITVQLLSGLAAAQPSLPATLSAVRIRADGSRSQRSEDRTTRAVALVFALAGQQPPVLTVDLLAPP